MPLRAVLFDLDETLLDFGRSQRSALAAALRRLDLPYSAARLELYRRINDRLWERYRRAEIGAAELAVERFREYLALTGSDPRRGARLSRTFEGELKRRAHLHPGCRRTLRALLGRFRLGVVTNGLTRIQHGRIRKAGLHRFFDTVVTSQACGVAKPDPRILTIALEALGVGPRDAVYVGDDPAVDQQAALAAGLAFVWVDRGRPLPRGVRAPRRRVTHLREVAGLLV
ncbi:MAG TPA: YjjG family noncanonical pyrimidine nucleotidase [Vicinamibacteria bacterium]|nr:YjjG family noncanonical pyrimidine nucleotidase [Vicinamibacteria bacterium]